MTTYVTYVPSGEIVSTLVTSFPLNEATKPPNSLEFENDNITIDTHYIENNQLKEYSEEEIQRRKARPTYTAYWNISNKTWQDARTATEVKTQKSQQINLERQQRNLQPIQYDNALFDANEQSQGNIRGWINVLAAGGILPENFVWRDYNDVNHAASSSWMLGLHTVIINRTTALYERSWQMKEELSAIPDQELGLLYSFSTGDYTASKQPNWPGVPPYVSTPPVTLG